MNVSVCLYFFFRLSCVTNKKKKNSFGKIPQKREKETVVAKIISREKKKIKKKTFFMESISLQYSLLGSKEILKFDVPLHPLLCLESALLLAAKESGQKAIDLTNENVTLRAFLKTVEYCLSFGIPQKFVTFPIETLAIFGINFTQECLIVARNLNLKTFETSLLKQLVL